MSHKVLLEFLVGIVDAQLLQVIHLKALEPVHIQNAWRQTGVCVCVNMTGTNVQTGVYL